MWTVCTVGPVRVVRTYTGAGVSAAAVSSTNTVPDGSVSFTYRDGADCGPWLSIQIVYVITSFGSPVMGLPCIERVTSGETAWAGDAEPMTRPRSRSPTAMMDTRTAIRMLPKPHKARSAEWEPGAKPPPPQGVQNDGTGLI